MPLKFGIGAAAAVDLGVGVFDRGPQGVGRGAIRELLIRQRHGIDGQFAGQFAGGVGPHPVGHHVQVPPLLKRGHAAGDRHGHRVLIVGTPQTRRPWRLRVRCSFPKLPR